MARALVLRAPGINCDRETAYACRLAGFETDLVHINVLRKTPERLLDYAFFVIPGGFSYGDDLGAGTLLAKNLSVHLSRQLHQFIDEGRLLLGICNGFQVLVRAGLLPGHRRRQADAPTASWAEGTAPTISDIPLCSLSDNASAQFECRWVTLSVEPGVCIFTQGIERCIQLPVAHGEGRFVLSEDAGKLTSLLARLQANGQIALVYGRSHDESGPTMNRGPTAGAISYPDNPNGSIGGIAGICNTQGNVFGLMPHPERYVNALQHPQRRGTVGAGVERRDVSLPSSVGELASAQGQGDGLLIFKNAYEYARKQERSPTMNRGPT